MAPQNLNQVFVANNATLLDDAQAFNTTAAASASKIGVWNLDAATPAFIDIASPVDIASLKRIQLVQAMPSGNPIASPIIDVKDIKRIKYTQYVASQRHTVAATFSAAVPTGNSYLVKIALRTAPTAYANYTNNAAVDLSGAGYEFPILGNFSAGRNILQVVEIAAGTSAANCGIAVTSAITNSTALSKLFTVSDNGAGVVTIVARHAGVVFDVVAFNSSTDASVITTSTTGFDAGCGNYWQALSDEKSQRSRYGNFNRMYFPFAFPEFAVSGTAYDVVEIQYAHSHAADTGIARAAELNTVKIYFVDTAAGSTVADTVFLGADAANWGSTNTERLF
jgi:hypothetical protein